MIILINSESNLGKQLISKQRGWKSKRKL